MRALKRTATKNENTEGGQGKKGGWGAKNKVFSG